MNDIDRNFDRVFEEMRTERSEWRAELRTERAQLRAEMKGLRAELHSEVQALRADMSAGFAELRADLAATRRQMTQIVWSFGIGLLGIMGTAVMTAVLRASL